MNFTTTLLKWYGSNARKFPWRSERVPYRVLIAELLLKRTRAENIISTYTYLVECYPNVAALARADLPALEGFLKPIGLYRTRARELKQIAEILVRDCNGQIPRDSTKLAELPGVGPYTTNAVLCFAYGTHVAVVDVNVKRVLGRYFSVAHDAKPDTYRYLAESLLPADAARFNWALLDFGALVCTAGNPRCDACPLANGCNFAKQG